MSVINFRRKEIIAKVVYYGPGLSGKTTNVQKIFASMPPDTRGELTALATEGDRTLFFDYVPIHLGNIGGFKTKFQIFTVPGQVFYAATRRVVLQSTDGVVFVADSAPDAMQRNLESLDDLRQNLLFYDKFLNAIPFVIQYNKRDLPNAVSLDVLERELNPLGVPSFPAKAMTGEGVLDTLSKISSLVLTHLKQSIEGKLNQGRKDPDMIERFDAEEPDDQILVRQLLEQIRQVRRDEHVAEVNIVDDDEEAMRVMNTRRNSRAAVPLPPLPSISAVGPVHDGNDPQAAPPGARLGSTGPSLSPQELDRNRKDMETRQTQVGAAGGFSNRSPEPSNTRAGERVQAVPEAPPVRTPQRDPGRYTGEFRVPQPPPAARGGAERPGAGHQPGDTPPWDARAPGMMSRADIRPIPPPPSPTARAVPVPAGTGLEIVDVGAINRKGADFVVPLTVREAGQNETRALTVQFRLVGGKVVATGASLPSWLMAWLGGVTVLALIALIVALR